VRASLSLGGTRIARHDLTQVMATGANCPMLRVMPTPRIPIALLDEPGTASIEIDGARVARGLGLEVATFRQLMADRKIALLCERGTGADAGRWRASFYHGECRVRMVVDARGNVLDED